MKPDAELPIVRFTHEFIVCLIPLVGKFPRDLRFTLGERIERQALLILELLIRARYQRERSELLEQTNIELEVLRYLVRTAHDLRALPTKAFGRIAGQLLELGQQLGGWRKSLASRPTR
ncbi:MAG: diversity-generating retroelement protein Avd [Pirellulales bacterium]|nr:diversity-generating retroelement protein Avd [Pirellulales bacterium]